MVNVRVYNPNTLLDPKETEVHKHAFTRVGKTIKFRPLKDQQKASMEASTLSFPISRHIFVSYYTPSITCTSSST